MREMMCSGVSSLTGDGQHVLFLDMDGHSLDEAIKKSEEMIHKFLLSDCYIFCSSPNNHHLICLDKFDFKDVHDILKRYAHEQWVKFRSRTQDFVLRMSTKGEKPEPRMMCEVKSPYQMHDMSNAHRLLLNKRYDLRIRKTQLFDDNKKLKIHFYRTRMVKE